MANRYDRHALIPGWDQDRLARAVVVVAGVGALGNEAARLLAMAGVGALVLTDPDRVAESNLSRTALFRPGDVGRLKVEAAAAALAELVPGVRVDPRPRPLANAVGLAELRDADLVLSCLDSRAARLQLAGRCGLVRAAWIDGGTGPWAGEVRPYLDPDGPCYGCGLSVADRAATDSPWSCLAAGPGAAQAAAAPMSALVGAWMATLAVRHLLGLPCPDATLTLDTSRGATTPVRRERDPDCPLHTPLERPTPVAVGSGDTVADLHAAVGPNQTAVAWEAVQERVECPRCGFAEERWGVPAVGSCPTCGGRLWPRTTLELAAAPGAARLTDLGIPPREVLAVRGPDGLTWVELRD